MPPADDESLPFFENVRHVLAVEVGDAFAEHLAQLLVDERLARRRELAVEDTVEVVQVPADALNRLSLAVTFPTAAPLPRSVLEAIRSWPRGRAALEPRPARVFRSVRQLDTSTPSGLPWRGQVQVTVHADGVPSVVVRQGDRPVVLPLLVSEVDGGSAL